MQKDPNQIIIFSRPVRTGKTTELFKFIASKKHVAGFLTPDVNGLRMLYDIAQQQYNAFETQQATGDDTVSIGKFKFLQKTFLKGQALLGEIDDAECIIIDEVGKLEIEQHLGFEPAITQLIATFKPGKAGKTLLLVIRDSLLQKAIIKYDLHSAKIITML